MSLLQCPVPCLQNSWELERLLEIYILNEPKNVLEIGSFFGGTLWYWLKYGILLQKIVSVDLPVHKEDQRYNRSVECRSKWADWIKDETIEYHFIEGNSIHEPIISRVNEIFSKKDIDWLFLDGGHQYWEVQADYINYSQLVRDGGLIIFHDILSERGVKMFWNELRYRKRTIEINCEFGIGIVYND